jgi:GNAT superfamily N-acetyltransferase
MKNFDSLQIRDANFEDHIEIQLLARLYVAVPLSWDPSYEFTEETIRKNYDSLLQKKDSLKCLLVISDSETVGIHILFKEKSSTECFVKTLWLRTEYRKQGLGSKLKQMGEDWARLQGAQKIVTHVMADNPMMLEINKSKGFAITKFEMSKSLAGDL